VSVDDAISALLKIPRDPERADYDLVDLSDAIQGLFDALGSEDISSPVEALVRAEKLSIAEGALLFDVATWSGSENGSSLSEALDAWMREGTDALRVSLALKAIGFRFRDEDEMRAVFTRIGERFPEHAPRCAELVRRRQLQREARDLARSSR